MHAAARVGRQVQPAHNRRPSACVLCPGGQAAGALAVHPSCAMPPLLPMPTPSDPCQMPHSCSHLPPNRTAAPRSAAACPAPDPPLAAAATAAGRRAASAGSEGTHTAGITLLRRPWPLRALPWRCSSFEAHNLHPSLPLLPLHPASKRACRYLSCRLDCSTWLTTSVRMGTCARGKKQQFSSLDCEGVGGRCRLCLPRFKLQRSVA